MGCDIHATLEYDQYYAKSKDKEHSWFAYATEIDIPRSYYLFTILSGVRDMGIRPIISERRGFPSDAGYEIEEQWKLWDSDGHNPGYATFKELAEWIPENPEVVDFDPLTFRSFDFYKTMEQLAKEYGEENVRIVFFYDN